MSIRKSTSDTSFGVALSVSTVIHLAVFLLLWWWGALFPQRLKVEETYYVDVVNLPVAAPRSGSPAQAAHTAAPAPQPPPPKAPAAPMALPAAKTVPKPPKAAAKTTAPTAAQENAELEERLKRMQNKAETQQTEDAIERLRRKQAAGRTQVGMPNANDTEAGSSYLNYITSRLSDAFSQPPNISRNAFALIKIRIVKAGTKGKVESIKIVQKSGNITFDNFAVRAINDAEKNFPAPPSGVFEFTFKFRPQGITAK